MKRFIMQCVRQALAGVRQAFRARLTSINTAPGVALIQAEALAGETLQAAELFQHYGFTSAPPDGTMLLVVPVGGNTAHGIVVGEEHTGFRLKGLTSGEVALYTDEDQGGTGHHIILKRGGIIEVRGANIDVRASEKLHLSAKVVKIHADERLETDTGGYGEAVNCTGGAWSIDSYRQGATPTTTEHGVQPPEIP